MKLRTFVVAAGVAAALAVSASTASANIIIHSLVGDHTGNMKITGDGDPNGNGLGEGFLSPETCVFAAGFTTCTITGSYLEDAASVPSIGPGTFEYRLVYAGNGVSPWRIEQVTAGGDLITGLGLFGAQQQLDLFPTIGPAWSAVTPNVRLAFNFVGATCVGVGTCTLNNVVDTPGATIAGPANLTLTLVTAVPEPGTMLLLGSGLAAAFVVRRRRA